MPTEVPCSDDENRSTNFYFKEKHQHLFLLVKQIVSLLSSITYSGNLQGRQADKAIIGLDQALGLLGLDHALEVLEKELAGARTSRDLVITGSVQILFDRGG